MASYMNYTDPGQGDALLARKLAAQRQAQNAMMAGPTTATPPRSLPTALSSSSLQAQNAPPIGLLGDHHTSPDSPTSQRDWSPNGSHTSNGHSNALPSPRQLQRMIDDCTIATPRSGDRVVAQGNLNAAAARRQANVPKDYYNRPDLDRIAQMVEQEAVQRQVDLERSVHDHKVRTRLETMQITARRKAEREQLEERLGLTGSRSQENLERSRRVAEELRAKQEDQLNASHANYASLHRGSIVRRAVHREEQRLKHMDRQYNRDLMEVKLRTQWATAKFIEPFCVATGRVYPQGQRITEEKAREILDFFYINGEAFLEDTVEMHVSRKPVHINGARAMAAATAQSMMTPELDADTLQQLEALDTSFAERQKGLTAVRHAQRRKQNYSLETDYKKLTAAALAAPPR